jgi:phosphatidate phosphatase APP1
MDVKIPILLNFYGLGNGAGKFLLFGQLTYTRVKDFTFKDYSRRKTFRTLLRLYQSKPFANQELLLKFDKGEVKVSTNLKGGFRTETDCDLSHALLKQVQLKDGSEVKLIEGLYHYTIQQMQSETIVVSDIDDTLMHSFIAQKMRKFRTLMFTKLEKRKAVEDMQFLVRNLARSGSCPVYLSNSEQNLYPLIFRFLAHNSFPSGPIFLKQLRSMWDVIRNIKLPLKNQHKIQTLQELLAFFPNKSFILIGDNTQSDLQIYIDTAKKNKDRVKFIIIRRVVANNDEKVIKEAAKELAPHGVKFFYDDLFPKDLDFSASHLDFTQSTF